MNSRRLRFYLGYFFLSPFIYTKLKGANALQDKTWFDKNGCKKKEL